MSAKAPRVRRFIRSEENLSITDAMDHPGLFQQWFAGSSWDTWRAILKAAFALPMSASECEVFRSVAEREPPRSRVRELWVVGGRRGGKDSIASLIAVYSAVFFYAQIDRLRPGERASVLCLACDRDQSRIVADYIKSYFDHIPPLSAMVRRRTENGLELSNDVDISVSTNSFRAVRGRSILVSIFDECAFWMDERSSRPDTETYSAVRPGLATLGGMLVGISSPYRKSGLLWQKYKAHYAQLDDDVLVVKAPTTMLNPMIDQAVIERALADDPAKARADWLAEFRDDISAWIDPDAVDACVARGCRELPASRGVHYVAFCDPSGGSSDSMTLAICHRDGDRVVLDLIREVRPPFSPDQVAFEFAAALKLYGVSTIHGDRYAGCWPAERFAAHGITYQQCATPKSDLYRDLLPLLNSGRVELLDHPQLVAQLCGLERRTARGGRDSIDNAPNGHDDVANAAAGALVLASGAAMGLAAISDASWHRILADVDAMPRYRWAPFPELTGGRP
jgi:hypothetical protein